MFRRIALACALMPLALVGSARADTPLTVSWVLVASAGATLNAQCRSTSPCILQISASMPSAGSTSGEVLNSGEYRQFNAALPNNLYARALNDLGGYLAVNSIGSAAAGGGSSTANQGSPGTNPWPTADAANAAFQGVVPMTVGTSYAAQRSIRMNCTAAGNVSLTLADTSTETIPVVVGYQTFPFAATAVNSSGTTATCSYANLK